jgi:hypothetical protein
MAKLRAKDWKHGSIMHLGFTLWSQKTPDGWFAKYEDEDRKILILAGPCETEDDAMYSLIDGAERFTVGTEGE